jgi:solute carrier family 4 anion exchanger 2
VPLEIAKLYSFLLRLITMERATKKGGGLHWDIVLICIVNVGAALIGGPWLCGACVRSVTHLAALTVMSTTHAPGELPKVVNVFDQRMTGLLASILVGLAILLAPVLQLIPYPVLFGVFIYMGVSAIFSGIQLFDRIFLLFMPVKHHPQVSYVRRVKTWKMHMFTCIQFSGLVLLWVIKSINEVALFFPLFVIAMIPLRLSLRFIFNKKELDAVSKAPSTRI